MAAVNPINEQELKRKFDEQHKLAEGGIFTKGNPEAQLYVGRAYDTGDGTAQNYVKAIRWYERAAKQGNVNAQHNLGLMYAAGRGTAKDESKAFGWYQEAANQGYIEAQFHLGCMYEKGIGVDPSDATAIEWYKRASANGNAKAKASLDRLRVQKVGAKVLRSKANAREFHCLTLLPSAELLCGSGSSINVWDLKKGRFLKYITSPGYTFSTVSSLQLLPNGQLASSSLFSNNIIIWDLKTSKHLKILEGHTSGVKCLTLAPNGELVSGGSTDKTIKVWDLKSGQCIKTLEGHASAVGCLTLLPSGELLSGSWDKTIKVWNLESGQCIKTFEGHTNAVRCLQLLPSGELVSGSQDDCIKLWNLKSGTCLKTLRGHADSVLCLQLLPSGELISGSYDKTIKVWNLESGQCIKTLEGHTSTVTSLALLPSGELVSGSVDETIKVWDPSELIVENKLVQKTEVESAQPSSMAQSSAASFSASSSSSSSTAPQYTRVQNQPQVSSQVVSAFLKLVTEGEQDQAEALLQKTPALALAPSDVTDLSERSFKGITGFQYAVWALDWHMWTMIRKYLPKETTAEQVKEMQKGSWVQQHGVSAAPLLQNLEKALRTCVDLWGQEKWKEGATTWNKQVGGAQRLLPVHVVNEYCRADRPFEPCPDFTAGPLPRTRVTDEGEWYTATATYNNGKLGETFANVRASYTPVAQWNGALQYAERNDGSHDLKACHTLLETRMQQRDALFGELSTLPHVARLVEQKHLEKPHQTSIVSTVSKPQEPAITNLSPPPSSQSASASSAQPVSNNIYELSMEDLTLLREAQIAMKQNHLLLSKLSEFQTQAANNQQSISETHQQLQDLRESIPHLKGKALSIIQAQEKELMEVLRKESQEQHKLQEQEVILNDPKLSDYYYCFQVQFNSIFIAAKAIHSDMVANDKDTNWGRAAKGIEKISKYIPIAGIIGEVLAGPLNYLDYRAKKKSINSLANFFPGVADAVAEALARQLALAQSQAIQVVQTGPKTGFVQKKLQNLKKQKDALILNDIDNEIKTLADQHCQNIIAEIMAGKLRANPSPHEIIELLQVVMGADYVYQGSCTIAEASAASAPTPMPTSVASSSHQAAAPFMPTFEVQRRNSTEKTKEELQALRALVERQERQLEEALKSQAKQEDHERHAQLIEEQKRKSALQEKQLKELEKKLKGIADAAGVSVDAGAQQQIFAQPSAHASGAVSQQELLRANHLLSQRLQQLEVIVQSHTERHDITDSAVLRAQGVLEGKAKSKVSKK